MSNVEGHGYFYLLKCILSSYCTGSQQGQSIRPCVSMALSLVGMIVVSSLLYG